MHLPLIFHRARPTMIALLALACAGGARRDEARGRGLDPAALPAGEQATIDAAAIRAAFDLDPSLSLLVDPQQLPRTAGVVGGDPFPADVARILRERGIVRGSCEPPRTGSRAVPVCRAELPGYVVRFSPVLRRSADTVEVYMLATRYRTAPTQPAEALVFERAYHVARPRGGEWRVAAEARIPQQR